MLGEESIATMERTWGQARQRLQDEQEDEKGGGVRSDCCGRRHLVGAVVLGARDQHLGELRVERELGHGRAELGEVTVVVERPKVVEQLERAHQRLGCWRVHEVKVHEVVDTELLEREHHAPEVAAHHRCIERLPDSAKALPHVSHE